MNENIGNAWRLENAVLVDRRRGRYLLGHGLPQDESRCWLLAEGLTMSFTSLRDGGPTHLANTAPAGTG
jgi:hypothetical protein